LGKSIKALQAGGFTVDFVSDKQLLASKMSKNGIYTEGSQFYKTIVVPRCDYMPLATLEALERFKKAGAKVVFVDKMPTNPNGFNEFDKRKTAFDALKKQWIRYLDKKGGAWKHFYDINMVDIGYRPFDASNWLPVESGLFGPIKVLTFK
jgi:hypothetical protein